MSNCYLIITCSIENHYGFNDVSLRTNLYKKAIQNTLAILPEYIKPIIVENNGKRPTFLDEFPCQVVYTDNNSHKHPHKGFNEMEDIRQVIKECEIQDEDMIIKLTGRYFPTEDHLFKHVKNMMHETDVFIKFFNVATRVFEKFDCVLGFFAMRCKYLKQFVYQGKKGAEIEFATFVHETIREEKIDAIRKLHAECCYANSNEVLQV